MDFYNQTVLPPRWARTALGELVEFTYGKALKEDRRDAGGKVPVYGSNGVVGTHSEALVSQPAVIIGRKGAAGEVHISHVPFWPIDTTYYAIPPDGLCLEFLYYVLKTLSLGSLDRSTAIPGLNRDDAYASEVSVPPFFEQRRIVAKIEEMFSKLDAGVEELEKAKAQLKRYRQSVLKAAFSGELTKEWREARANRQEPIETAKELLERIRKERQQAAANSQRKYKEPPPLDTSELPELPEGWAWVRLDAVASIKGGITKDAKRKVPGGRMVPYLRVANVQRGYLDMEEITEILASEDEIAELRLRRGDILFTEGGDRDKLGRGWVWNEELPECIHQNHVFRARLYVQDVQPKYVSWYGNTMGRGYFQGAGKQTTNLASINITKLSGLPVALPPAQEQAAIVSEVEDRLSILDEMEKAVDISEAQAARLRQAILKRAFEGRLTEEWRRQQANSQEPMETAEELLKRIREAKAKRQMDRKPRASRQRAKRGGGPA